MKRVTEKFLSKSIQYIKTVCCLLLNLYFRTEFRFFYLNIVPVGQPFQCFNIRKFLMLHQKADRVATSSTTKTFIYFLCRGDRKGRRFFIMKRAKPKIISAPFFQLY